MKKIIRIILTVLLIVIIFGTFYFLWSKSKKKPVEYETIKVEYRNIEKSTVITGTIEPRNEVAIKPQIQGIIAELYKSPGDIVTIGDVIAKVQVVPDINQLNNAESQLKMVEISLDKAKTDYERAAHLHKSGIISTEEHENANVLYQKAVEEVVNVKESIQIIKEGISNKTAKYSNTQVKATISGMILDIPVKVGNSVIQTNTFNDGTTIATIANMNDLIFIGKVDETEVGKIAVGNEVKLIIGALKNTTLNAVLEYISPKGALSNGATLFEIKAAVKLTESNSVDLIRSGYSANGEIILDKRENVLAIPESSVEFVMDSTFVYLLETNTGKKESTYVKTPVTLGLSDGIYVELLSPIDTAALIRGKVKIDMPFMHNR